MNEAINDFLQRQGPVVVPFTGLLLLAFAAVFVALARLRGIYPHVPLVVIMLVPCLLALGLLIDPKLLWIILIADAVVLVVAAADVFTLPGQKAFAVERVATKVASLKKKHPVALHIDNLSPWPMTAWIRDDLPAGFEPDPKEFILRLDGRSRSTVNYELTASRRGAFEQKRVYVRVRSRFGLWQRLLEYPLESALHVYPDMKQLSEYEILARTNRLSLMGVRRTRKIGSENDFERLRDYTPDDNYKFLDWRASARRNKLTVKDFQQSQSQRIIFLLDCGRMMTNTASGLSLLDHSLNAALMLSYVALRQGDSVGMIAFADQILAFVPPMGGMNQMNQILHASFNRHPQLVESRYDEAFLHLATHCRKRSLVVLITNLIDEVNAHQVRDYLSNLVGKHLPLGVLLRDRQLFDAADKEPQTDAELFRAAAASEILLWRHQVLTDMEHQGILALDVFPEDMTAPLVNSYLNIKARHLL